MLPVEDAGEATARLVWITDFGTFVRFPPLKARETYLSTESQLRV